MDEEEVEQVIRRFEEMTVEVVALLRELYGVSALIEQENEELREKAANLEKKVKIAKTLKQQLDQLMELD